MSADWGWPLVKFKLAEAGLTLADVARRAGMTPAACHQVARLPLPRAQGAIAGALGLKPWEIWPTRYDSRGRPIRRKVWMSSQKTDQAA